MNSEKLKIEDYLKKRDFVKISGKEVFMQGKTPFMKIVDLSGDQPWIGLSTGTQRQEADETGQAVIQDIKNDVLNIYNSHTDIKKSPENVSQNPLQEKEPPISSITTPIAPVSSGDESYQFFCSNCKTKITGEQRSVTFKQYKKAYCLTCTPTSAEEARPEQKELKLPAASEKKENEHPQRSLPEPNAIVEKTEADKVNCNLSLLENIKTYVNNDVLEIFGDSGTGKSKFCVEVAREAIANGKSVFYLDTERNLSQEEVEKLKGCQYKYTPIISEISTITRSLPRVDLVIIDSIGFPILTAYARMSMKQKGDALLNMIAIFGDLKEWAYKNNGIAIVVNQPESDFNKEPGHLLRPFGDKSQFAAKEIWKTELTARGAVTKTDIRAFRSRSVGHKTLIAKMEVSNSGTTVQQTEARKP